MKSIKYFIFFMKESSKFTNKSIVHLLFKDKLLKRAVKYVKNMNKWDEMLKRYGSLKAYCMLNKNIEIEVK